MGIFSFISESREEYSQTLRLKREAAMQTKQPAIRTESSQPVKNDRMGKVGAATVKGISGFVEKVQKSNKASLPKKKASALRLGSGGGGLHL